MRFKNFRVSDPGGYIAKFARPSMYPDGHTVYTHGFKRPEYQDRNDVVSIPDGRTADFEDAVEKIAREHQVVSRAVLVAAAATVGVTEVPRVKNVEAFLSTGSRDGWGD